MINSVFSVKLFLTGLKKVAVGGPMIMVSLISQSWRKCKEAQIYYEARAASSKILDV